MDLHQHPSQSGFWHLSCPAGIELYPLLCLLELQPKTPKKQAFLGLFDILDVAPYKISSHPETN